MLKISTRPKLILFIFIFFWCVLAPVFSLFIQMNYLSYLYFVAFIVHICITRKFYTFSQKRLLIFYLALHVFLIIAHPEVSSILNLGALFVSVYMIALIARNSVIHIPEEKIEVFIAKILAFCLLCLMIISTILTAFNVTGAPSYFFWQSFLSDQRLLLIVSGVGHTINTWLLPFLFFLLLTKKTNSSFYTMSLFFLLVFSAFFIIQTKTRISLLFLLFMVYGFCYRVFIAKLKHSVVFFSYSVVCGSLALASLYLLLPFSPVMQNTMASVMKDMQSVVPNVRIYSPGHSIASGREVLTAGLLAESAKHPFIGSGNRADMLRYGVDRSGEIAYDDTKRLAGSESSFRLAVKYGWLYYLSVLMLIFSPLIGRRWKHKRNVTTLFISMTVFITFIFSGAMENYYGNSSLFLLLILIYYFRISESSITGEFS